MELKIKQRVFSWGDSYDVYDQYGEPKYYVASKLFTLGHQIHVFDKRTDREVGAIRQKIWSLLPQFEILIDGKIVGTIRKEFTFFTNNYSVDYCNWEVNGDFIGWEYTAYRDGNEVLSVTKELTAWADAYSLRFSDAADEIPALLLVIAIDAANSHGD